MCSILCLIRWRCTVSALVEDVLIFTHIGVLPQLKSAWLEASSPQIRPQLTKTANVVVDVVLKTINFGLFDQAIIDKLQRISISHHLYIEYLSLL